MTCPVVVYNWADWLSNYPEFGWVTMQMGQRFFNRVTIGGLVDNTPSSIIPYDPTNNVYDRQILLNEAVAHVAFLYGGLDGNPREAVGRVADGTQGSVTVRLEYVMPKTELAAWWNQSTYGAMFYASTLRFRTAFYVPPAPQKVLGFGGLRGFGWR